MQKFGEVFDEVRAGAPIEYGMLARALAEYEFILKGANAPIDHFARGEHDAMTDPEKRGALLFFGKANCVACHAVGGKSNEMFSDFGMHNIGVPQIAPVFGLGTGNVLFDGPGEDEDYGLAQVTGLARDRYRFRTSPLRNYDAKRAGVAPDLAKRMAPIAKVAASIDPLLRRPTRLSTQEFEDLVQFVRNGLLDQGSLPALACTHVPASLPSGMPLPKFEACPSPP